MRIFSFLSFCLIVHVCIVSISIHAEDFTVVPHSTREHTNKPLTLSNLLEPINPTGDGLEYFLRSVFSHPGYAIDVLPNSFQHMHQLLVCSTPTNQKIAYNQSIVRLFSNRLKSCTFVNPSALTKLLETLPRILLLEETNLLSAKKEQEKIVDVLYQGFLSNFGAFKTNPDDFFATLSKKITKNILYTQRNNAQELFAFRTTFLSFLEISLGKLVWSPQDQEKTWDNVKVIAQHLTALADANLITNQDQLCDLFITLTERYRFFVELMHESLSVEFFEKTRNNILQYPLPLLGLAEQEDFIESRKDRLLRSLEICEARARAREFPSQAPRSLFSEERETFQEKGASKKSRKRRRRS